jgi:hypothetical protein
MDDRDGAFVKQSGRNRWQRAASETAPRRLALGETVAVGYDRLSSGARRTINRHRFIVPTSHHLRLAGTCVAVSRG